LAILGKRERFPKLDLWNPWAARSAAAHVNQFEIVFDSSVLILKEADKMSPSSMACVLLAD